MIVETHLKNNLHTNKSLKALFLVHAFLYKPHTTVLYFYRKHMYYKMLKGILNFSIN